MKKKILIFTLLVFYVFGLTAFAASDEEKVYVSDFCFVDGDGNLNTLTSDSDVTAKCTIQRLDDDEANGVPYEFVIQIRRDGKLISLISDGAKPIEVKGHIDGDASECKVTAFLFSGVDNLIPLANNAIYGSDVALLDRITVDNATVNNFAPDILSYTYKFDAYPTNTPVLRIFPTDYSAITEISGVFPSPIKYKLTSSDGTKENEYEVKFDIAKKQKSILCSEHFEKVRNKDMSTAKIVDPESTTVYTTSVRLNMNSYLNVSTVNADNIAKFTNCSYFTFNFADADVAMGESVILKLRAKLNKATLYDGLNICVYEFNPLNDTPELASEDYGYLGKKIISKNIKTEGIATANSGYDDFE